MKVQISVYNLKFSNFAISSDNVFNIPFLSQTAYAFILVLVSPLQKDILSFVHSCPDRHPPNYDWVAAAMTMSFHLLKVVGGIYSIFIFTALRWLVSATIKTKFIAFGPSS